MCSDQVPDSVVLAAARILDHVHDFVPGTTREEQLSLVRISAPGSHPYARRPRRDIEFHPELLIEVWRWGCAETGGHETRFGLPRSDQGPWIAAGAEEVAAPVAEESDISEAAHHLDALGEWTIEGSVEPWQCALSKSQVG